MPKIEAFKKYSQRYVNKCLWVSSEAVKKATESGAEYMRENIQAQSPTGTKWHIKKNNDAGTNGARVTTGKMLKAVGTTKITSNTRRIYGNFGWVRNKKDYYLMQDTGGYWLTAYGKPSGIGMGLLNTAQDGGGRKTLRVLGAYNHSWNQLIEEMKKAGFAVSKEGQEVF